MKNRRNFLKMTALAGLSTGGLLQGFSLSAALSYEDFLKHTNMPFDDTSLSLIGQYGSWANSLIEKELPKFSFRRNEWTDIAKWKNAAKQRLIDRLSIPVVKKTGSTTTHIYEYDGLRIEELEWQLAYGRPTKAILLKPINTKGKLPGILAFHDHGGNKYLGVRKITRTSDIVPSFVAEHQQESYEGLAWANEIAKRGYVVLVPDAFPFASRRVMLQDVPEHLRNGLTDDDPENPEHIKAYNEWAAEHEHIMAKSLFSAGTTWPGVFFAEDRVALDILCSRPDVDNMRIGCGGLSGGGMRTVFMGGLDERIKCAVCVGFMTTWKDFILHKSFTHTWMTYVPLLPNELDFPEILGLRTPLPTYVLNDIDDGLYTLPEMKRADAILKDIYKKAGASENYKCSFYPGPHKFDRKMQADAFDWFDQWLK